MLKASHVQKAALAVLGAVVVPILTAYYLGIKAAWIVGAFCVIIIILFWSPVRAKTKRWSETILQRGARRPMYYFWIFFGVGAVLWGIVFGGTWFYVLYAYKSNPPSERTPTVVTDQEVQRRKDLLKSLRQEYILSHDNLSPEMLAGTEPLPEDWLGRRLKEMGETWRPTAEQGTSEVRKPTTLRELFLADCENTKLLSTYQLTRTADKQASYEIEYLVCGDFETKSLYLSFFLPKSDRDTFSACKYLPTVHERILAGPIRSLMEGIIHQTPGEKAESWDELKSSGRIFVYHETRLLSSQIDELTEAYKKKGFSPLFRSRDYEIMRNSPLYPDK